MLLPNSPVGTPPTPNKQLYNGGSEWQNDFSNMPDYQQTFYRNYDAAIGRFVGVDPMAESAESMTTYQYAGNNPVMFNDPMGDLLPTPGSRIGTNQTQGTQNMINTPGLTTGDYAPVSDWQNEGVFGDGGFTANNYYGLYGSDPALANYLATTYGTSIYKAGSGSGIGLDNLTALLNGTQTVTLSQSGFWSTRDNTAQASNYGNIRGGVVTDFGMLGSQGGGQCPNCLMPGTAGKNLWDTNYTGKDNPLSYDRTENYSLPPTNRADYGSLRHDKGYDKYNAVGPTSVMTNIRTIGVDYQFIGYELGLAGDLSPFNNATLQERAEGLANGLYMFIFTLPKTIAAPGLMFFSKH